MTTSKLDLRKSARSQGKSARAGSGLTDREVAIATSKEGKVLPAEVSWSGDGGGSRKSSKQVRLEQINADILKNNVCPNLAKTATQLVFGSGSADADIVFVGEAPGKNEDLQGVPFVGAAGKFLDEMLETIGLKRRDVYITNIVKYRPPNNRDPLPEEKQAFLPYLQSQLEVIAPKIVVTLGRHSLNCFLPDLQISMVHGQPKRIRIRNTEFGNQNGKQIQEGAEGSQDAKDFKAWVILPLFHPAAALYNGGMRQTLLEDFSKIPAILEQIEN